MNNDHYYYEEVINNSRNIANMQGNTTNNQSYEILTPINQNNPKIQSCDGAVNPSYLQSYLTTQIGRWMNVDMNAANHMHRQMGQLIHVGSDFIVLKLSEPLTTFICTIDSIKFVTIIYHNDYNKLLMP